MRYANFRLYRRTSEISNVHTAIQLFGIRCIRSVIVSATIHSALSAENKVGQRMLSHMLDVSVMSKLIARKCWQKAADDLEFLGLFHDIDMLILAENYPEQYVQLLARASSESKPVDVIEKEVFGISHDQVTARASHDFRLPLQYQDLLKEFHSRPLLTEMETESDQYVAILSLAHYLWITVKQNEDGFCETLGEPLESLKELLVISPEQWVGLVEEANLLLSSTRDEV